MSNKDEPNHSDTRDPNADFERRLKAKLDERRTREARENPNRSGWSIGLRYGSDFFAGVIVGVGGGLLIDRLLGWSPWGLIVGLLLGFAAGTLNVVRAAKNITAGNDASDKQ
ncbi:MAG: hypothetical protein CMF74_08990 [Maricaulis sp.]|jgi:ATP synthase protein I|nr:hypothetical protein [Maricaulis sp.]HAQ35990.1 hypothetical protein [Alphaproteobacteria bacterium]